jgi:hypothetical protein
MIDCSHPRSSRWISEYSEWQQKKRLAFLRAAIRTRQQPTFALFCTIIGCVSLTFVFGMGTGVSSRTSSPDNNWLPDQQQPVEANCNLQVSLREPFIKVAKLSSISIGQLRSLLTLHLRPINLVVYQGTSELAFNET